MTSIARVSPSSDAVFTRLSPTSGTVLNLVSKRYYTLNETGLRIWELIEEVGDPGRIAALLHEEFEIAEDAAKERVRAFVEDLRQEKLVEVG